MSLFAEGSFSAPATDDSSHIASSSSTPPTTIADSASLHSESSKHEETIAVADDIAPAPVPPVTAEDVPSPRRARRARAFSPVYNLSKLSGTSAHGWRRSKGDAVSDRRRRTLPSDALLRSCENSAGLVGSAAAATGAGAVAIAVAGSDASASAVAVTSSGAVLGPADQRDASNALGALNALLSPSSSKKLVTPSAARQARASPRGVRSSSRLSGATGLESIPLSLTASLSVTSQRGKKGSRKSIEALLASLPLELRRLQDTKEFARIDDRPVIETVWSNGKFVDPTEAANAEPPARKKTKIETPEEKVEEEEQGEEGEDEIMAEEAPEPTTQVTRQRAPKKYLSKGLYSGQEYPKDVTRCLSTAEKKELAQYPELKPAATVNKTMPAPIFTGLRLLLKGRDFKLPYNVCNPLPPGQPKPDEWKKITKNRFIGGSKDIWRKLPHINDYQSKCVCQPEDGCGESCQNRIMLYECDATNCNVGKTYCTNRAFADLTTRRTKGGKYRVGVEVIKTSDRGYGVRSNRCFEPHQIIMEYTGEIITEEECERRMKEIYKDNECYYLMSFDQNMIIDATTGSITRFVNHSCNPNCRMIKWIVSGQPRMALFAGDRAIMTGEELTYDYNFDPFSAKNVQKCLCGQPNCRGVLGPRPREVRQSKADKISAGSKEKVGTNNSNSSSSSSNNNNNNNNTNTNNTNTNNNSISSSNIKKAIKATIQAGKRKLKELLEGEDDETKCAEAKTKKRKIAALPSPKQKQKDEAEQKGDSRSQPQSKGKSKTIIKNVSKSFPGTGSKVAKVASTAMKKGLSTMKTSQTKKTISTINKAAATATATASAGLKTKKSSAAAALTTILTTTAKTASTKTTMAKTASNKTASNKTAPNKTAPNKTASNKTASNKTAPNKTASNKTASNKTASNKTASNKTASNKTASNKRIIKTYGSGSRAKMGKPNMKANTERVAKASLPQDEPFEVIKDAILVKKASSPADSTGDSQTAILMDHEMA